MRVCQSALLVLALNASLLYSQRSDWRNGIVQVATTDKSPGTGFVASIRSGRAYVITCAHVVAGDQNPLVTFNSDPEKRRFKAEVRNSDRRRDLALLVVEKPPENAAVVEPLINSVAGPIVVAGYPGEEEGKFTILPGAITSAGGTELSIAPAMEEGFSGGPVVADGRVIGVVFEHTRTFGKAIPATIVDLYLRGLDVRWEPAPGTVRENAMDGLKYVWLLAGKFTMGCSPADTECNPEEKPPHAVEITRGFWMGQTEVTQAAYEKVTKTKPSYFPGADRPVDHVSWNDAQAYCEAVGLRLPTEAEWEYAARAGGTSARYGTADKIAWYDVNSDEQTHPVGTKDANAWGLYDMLGNLWEWTADWYDKDYSNQKASKDPQGPSSSTGEKVMRGGSWDYDAQSARVTSRVRDTPMGKGVDVGFRCAGDYVR